MSAIGRITSRLKKIPGVPVDLISELQRVGNPEPIIVERIKTVREMTPDAAPMRSEIDRLRQRVASLEIDFQQEANRRERVIAHAVETVTARHIQNMHDYLCMAWYLTFIPVQARQEILLHTRKGETVLSYLHALEDAPDSHKEYFRIAEEFENQRPEIAERYRKAAEQL